MCRHGIHAIQRPSLRIRDTRQVTLTMSEEKSNQHHVTTKTINGTQVEDTPSGNQRKTLHTNMKLLTKKDVGIQPQNHRTESDSAGGRHRKYLKKKTNCVRRANTTATMTQNTPERKGKHGDIGLQSELGKV